jgi:Fe-S-cluster containining protein
LSKTSNKKKVLTQAADDNPCADCDACCKYVSVEIDKPTTKTELEDIKFYLYHKGVSVYIDFDHSWNILYESRCDKLDQNGSCTIYEERPPLCKDFDREDCHEQELDDSHKVSFYAPEDLMRYIKKARPVFYKKHYSSHRKNRRAKA